MTKGRKIFLGVGGALAALAVASVLWSGFRSDDKRSWRYWARRLEQSEAEARAAGIWVNLQDVREAPVDPARDGTRKLIALEVRTSNRIMRVSGGGFGGFADPKQRADFDKAAADWKKELPLFFDAMKAKEFDWSPRNPAAYDAMMDVTWMIQAIIITSYGRALKGDTTDLTTIFAAADRHSAILAESGTWRGLSHSVSIKKDLTEAYSKLARHPKVPVKAVEELARYVEPRTVSWSRAMRYEPMVQVMHPKMPGMHRKPEWTNGITDPGMYFDWDAYQKSGDQERAKGARSFNLSYWAEIWPDLDKTSAELARRAEPSYVKLPPSNIPWPLEHMYGGLISEAAKDHLRQDLDSRMDVVGGRVHLFRRKEGRWPTLNDSISLTDPWTGNLIGFAEDGGRVWVWSGGQDGVFVSSPRSLYAQGDDVVAKY